MQLPSPVGIATPSSVVPPPTNFSSDVRIRVGTPQPLVLTGAFQSINAIVPAPRSPSGLFVAGTVPDIVVRWHVFVLGAAGAVTGVQYKVVPSGAGNNGALITSRGPAGAVTSLQQFTSVLNVVSPAYITFDISALPAVEIDLEGYMGGVKADGASFDLQMQNAGAGIYTVFAIAEAWLR